MKIFQKLTLALTSALLLLNACTTESPKVVDASTMDNAPESAVADNVSTSDDAPSTVDAKDAMPLQDYHVAIDGDDSNDGSTSAPFRTIAYATSLLQAGNTLIVHPGDYGNENIVLETSGTADNPITIMAEIPGSVILNGTRPANSWGDEYNLSDAFTLYNESASVEYINIDGFYIKKLWSRRLD